MVAERLLQRRQLAVAREPLDRLDRRAVGLDGEQHAALHRQPSTMDRAGAAVAGVAADVRPGQVEVVADEVDEQAARLDLALVALAVDLDRDRALVDGSVSSRPSRSRMLDGADRAHLGEVAAVVGRAVDVGRRIELRAGARPRERRRSSVRCHVDEHGDRVDAAERDPRPAVPRHAAALTMHVPSRPIVTASKPSAAVRGGGIEIESSSSPGADRGHVDAEEELVGRDRRARRPRRGSSTRAERNEQRRKVVRRVARADVAADRSAVPHLDVGDRAGDLGEDRPRGPDFREARSRVGRHRADLEPAVA